MNCVFYGLGVGEIASDIEFGRGGRCPIGSLIDFYNFD